HIRFALPLIQETSAKKEIPRPDSPRLETRPPCTQGFGRPPGDESEWDSAQHSQFLFPRDVAGLRRVPVLEWHRRDKRAGHNPPRTASQPHRFPRKPDCIATRVRAAGDLLLGDDAI